MYIQVYESPQSTTHYAPFFSSALLLKVLGRLSCIVLAVVVSVSSGEVWQKHRGTVQHPEVTFTYKAMLRVTERSMLQDGTSNMLWTTNDAVNELLGARLGLGQLSVLSKQQTPTAVPTEFHIELGVANVNQVKECSILLEFLYKTQGAVSISAPALVHIQHSSPVSGSELIVSGTLRPSQDALQTAGIQQNIEDWDMFSHNVTNRSELGRFAPFDESHIWQRYDALPNKIGLADVRTLWKAGEGHFNAMIDIHIPQEQTMFYRPRALSEIKWAFVQWLAVYLVLHFVYHPIEAALFLYNVVDTCRSDPSAMTW